MTIDELKTAEQLLKEYEQLQSNIDVLNNCDSVTFKDETEDRELKFAYTTSDYDDRPEEQRMDERALIATFTREAVDSISQQRDKVADALETLGVKTGRTKSRRSSKQEKA